MRPWVRQVPPGRHPARHSPPAAPPDTGDVYADFAAHLRLVVSRFRDGNHGRAIADLLAEAQHEPSVAAAFRDRWLASRRAAGRERLFIAQEAGQVRRNVDLEALLDVLYAPIYYRLLSGHAPLDDRLADELVHIALSGAGTTAAPERR